MSEAAARMLINEGFCHIPVNRDRVAEAKENFASLFATYVPATELCGTRFGEDGPDVGLIRKTKAGGGDDKWYIHITSDMDSWLSSEAQNSFLEQQMAFAHLSEFRAYICEILMNFSTYVQAELGILDGCFRTAIATCSKKRVPYAVNTLRGLFYESGPQQTGAKAHIDRDFLTGHCGDEGGVLQAQIDGGWQSISPPDGQLLVFAGAKALWMTKGKMSPLLHRSITSGSEDRRAMVFFGQSDIGYCSGRWQNIVREFRRRHSALQ